MGDEAACDLGWRAALTPGEALQFQDPAGIARILEQVRVIAVVGCSRNPAKPAHYVPAYLQQHGYRIVPVNPNGGVILGAPVLRRVRDLEEPVDLILVFRPGPACLEVAEDAITIGAPRIWFQLGIPAVEAARRAAGAGLAVVLDRCMMVEHRASS